MTWSTPDFINGFFEDVLGRKKVHAGWRVLDGKHCQILVKSTTRRGTPGGSEIYAMKFMAKGQRIVFIHPDNTYSHSYRIRRDLKTEHYQKLPSGYMRDMDTAIRESGIIDMTEGHALIEFGDKPALLCREYGPGGAPATTDVSLPKWGSIEPLSKRVSTIAEAVELTKNPEGGEIIADAWYAKAVADSDVPPFEPELTKVLAEGINPVDYGYKIEELQVEDAVGEHMRLLAVQADILSNKADKRSISYLAAVEAYYQASKKFEKYKPPTYDGITIKKDRYAYGNAIPTTTGTILCTTQGVFVTGLIKSSDNFSEETSTTGWYKLVKRITRKKLA
jgi:hypothetical protein